MSYTIQNITDVLKFFGDNVCGGEESWHEYIIRLIESSIEFERDDVTTFLLNILKNVTTLDDEFINVLVYRICSGNLAVTNLLIKHQIVDVKDLITLLYTKFGINLPNQVSSDSNDYMQMIKILSTALFNTNDKNLNIINFLMKICASEQEKLSNNKS